MNVEYDKSIFATNLKHYMDKAGINSTDICKLMSVSKSTVSDWCNGKKIPRMDKVEKLAQYFGINKSGLIEEKPAVEVAVPDCPVVPIYNALNESGRKEYMRYGRYLTAQPEYLAKDAEPQVEYIRHYLTAAAAGYAAPIEGEDYEDIPLPADAPSGADFCIDIDGDSMEPYIKNGSRVFVKRDVAVREMDDVGIFFVDGDVYCKQYCVDFAGTLHLLSANPKREDANKQIARDSASTVVCFGKVLLGKKLPAPTY